MAVIKKIWITILLLHHVTLFVTHDEGQRKYKKSEIILAQKQQENSSAVLWTGIAGAVAGTALGYWLSELDADSSQENVQCYVICDVDMYAYQPQSAKAYQIKLELDRLAKYGQYFDLSDDEQAIISTLHKLGVRLHQIDTDFYCKLERDHKILNDAGYSIWWHGCKELEGQKNLYLSNSKKIIHFFNRHKKFIQVCQIINSYDQLPAYIHNVSSWLYRQSYSHRPYPFIDYTQKIEADRKILMQMQRNYCYSLLSQKVFSLIYMLDDLLEMVYESDEYQSQVAQKRQDELMIELNRIEQEKLDIAHKQIKIQQERNRIAAERNQIERDSFFYRDEK